MKKYFLFIPAILAIASACSSLSNKSISENDTIVSKQYSGDRAALLNFEPADQTDPKLFENKTADRIDELSKQGYDLVILDFKNFPHNQTSLLPGDSKIVNSIRHVSSRAGQKGLNFFLKINFKEFGVQTLPLSEKTSLINGFLSIIKNCEVDGLYFDGIDLSRKEQNSLFEEIVVRTMQVKPFIIIAARSGLDGPGNAVINNLIEGGVIDFLIDEKMNFSIEINERLKILPGSKLLSKFTKRLSPEHFISLNLSEVTDNSTNEVLVLNDSSKHAIGTDSIMNFIFSGKTDTLKIKIGDALYLIPKSDWVFPYNYFLHRDNSTSRYGNWIEFRRPFAGITSIPTYNLLCRTQYPSEVSINDSTVKIYKTGIFFRRIKLKDGLNKLRAEAKSGNGETAIYEDRVLYNKPDTAQSSSKLTITDDSIEPSADISLMPEDYLTVSFTGTKTQKGFVEINPSSFLFECSRTDLGSISQYKARIPLKNFTQNRKYSIKLILKPVESNSFLTPIEKSLNPVLTVKDFSDFPALTTISDNSILTYTLAPIRLGPPVRNELPKNVILKSNGIIGGNYRVRLSDTEEGFINRDYVKEIPGSSVIPGYFINPIIGQPADNSDLVRIPYPENIPYDIYPDPAQKRITINLYGVKTSSTWIIHRNDLRFIEEITWQQTSKETYKIYINLKTSKIWGYDIKPNGKELIFRIKYPPVYSLESVQPLKGIKVSIEAGHGGSGIGAVGLSGIKEKDINLKLSLMLENLLRQKGADVLQVRDADKDMTLLEKRNIATRSDANIHISIHANSSDPEDEYLGVSGTCTFYNNPFWAKLAEKIYYRMTELGLKPFGSVGSFNYRVTRMSEMPSILVEQAFMSHAEDEEKLNDDNFRMKMAEKIYNGIIDYLEYMKN